VVKNTNLVVPGGSWHHQHGGAVNKSTINQSLGVSLEENISVSAMVWEVGQNNCPLLIDQVGIFLAIE